MANTFTTNYNLTKPEIGGANDQWGSLVNSNFDTLDTEVYTKIDKSLTQGVTHSSLSFNGTNITTTNTNGFRNFVAGDRIFISNASTHIANSGEFVIQNKISDTVLDLKEGDGTTDPAFQQQTISSVITLTTGPSFQRLGLSQLTGEIRLFGSNVTSVINNLGSVSFRGGTRYYWLQCNGQAVNKTTYNELYTVLKNGTGSCVFGESSTTFNLPDLRGRVPVGDNTMGSSAVGRMPSNADEIAQSGGAHEHTLTANQSGVKAHGHAHTISVTSGTHTHEHPHTHNVPAKDATMTAGSGGTFSLFGTQHGTASTGASEETTGDNTSYTNTVSGGVTNHAGESAGEAHSILQPYLIVGSFIIAT